MLLLARGITCQYGSVTALRDVTVEVDEGEVVAILGANGAGKSTLMKALAGLLPPVSGEITVRGEPIHHRAPNDIVAHGVSLVAEGRRVFPKMSVADNLLLGAYVNRGDKDRVVGRREEMYALFPALGDRTELSAGHLSGGQQQMLAIAQALMAEPQVLLLDEPSLGLAPSIVTDVFDAIKELKRTGITIVIVEQMVRQALSIASRGYVLKTGHLVAKGTAEELREDPAVREAYLGLVNH